MAFLGPEIEILHIFDAIKQNSMGCMQANKFF